MCVLACVSLEDDGQLGGKRPQIFGVGQRGQQGLWVHPGACFLDAGAQVQVQAALEALLDKVGVRAHQAKGRVSASQHESDRGEEIKL